MTPRGTRIITGDEARLMEASSRTIADLLERAGYERIIVPSLWTPDTFADKARPEQLWSLADRSGRPLVLIPEVTGVVTDWWRAEGRSRPKPGRVFYEQRCYRYERPQAGRYREFSQIGIELLGGRTPDDATEVRALLLESLEAVGLRRARFVPVVARNLGYYVEDGFEVEADDLGAQRQVAGGGRYAEGIGWAIGLDRLVLALSVESGAATERARDERT